MISLAAGAVILCCGAALAFPDDSSSHTVFVEFGSTTW